MLTKDRVKTIHADIQKALQEVAKKHKLNLSPASKISYTPSTFKFTAEFGDLTETGGADPRYLNNIKRHGWTFGLDESDIGKSFTDPKYGRVTIEGMVGTKKVAVTLENGSKGTMSGEYVKAFYKKGSKS